MKKVILVFLVLIPLVFAQASSDYVLEARKATLDQRASSFITEMGVVIDYASNNKVDPSSLTSIKTEFESKLKDALQSTNKDDLNDREKYMRTLSSSFRDNSRKLFNDTKVIYEIRSSVSNALKNSDELTKKEELSVELKRKAIGFAYDARMSELKSKIDENTKSGKSTKVYELLLSQFERDKLKVNETDVEKSISIQALYGTKDTVSKTLSVVEDIFSSVKNFIVDKSEKIGSNG